jgi:hypothetical protein
MTRRTGDTVRGHVPLCSRGFHLIEEASSKVNGARESPSQTEPAKPRSRGYGGDLGGRRERCSVLLRTWWPPFTCPDSMKHAVGERDLVSRAPALSLSVVAGVLFVVGLQARKHQAASSSLRPVHRFSSVTRGMAPRNILATTEGPKSAVGGFSMWKTSRNVRRTPMSCRESASTRSM